MFIDLTAPYISSRLRAVGILRLSAFAVLCLGFAATGCTQREFQEDRAKSVVATNPFHLDAEQVLLTGGQLGCGVDNDLWETPTPATGQRVVAHLLPAGRALHFDDDPVVSEPGFRSPYVQVRGDFMLQLGDGPNIREDGEDVRVVDGRLYALIPNGCFPDPLQVMGVRKGRFSQDVNPVMQFRLQDDGWHLTKLVH